MNQRDRDKIKKSKHVWTVRDVQLGDSDIIIPEGTEGILLSGVCIDGRHIVWFYSMGKDPKYNMAYQGVVPQDSLRW